MMTSALVGGGFPDAAAGGMGAGLAFGFRTPLDLSGDPPPAGSKVESPTYSMSPETSPEGWCVGVSLFSMLLPRLRLSARSAASSRMNSGCVRRRSGGGGGGTTFRPLCRGLPSEPVSESCRFFTVFLRDLDGEVGVVSKGGVAAESSVAETAAATDPMMGKPPLITLTLNKETTLFGVRRTFSDDFDAVHLELLQTTLCQALLRHREVKAVVGGVYVPLAADVGEEVPHEDGREHAHDCVLSVRQLNLQQHLLRTQERAVRYRFI